ncbi:queuine tRNA-ribosyltransferase accessory subunit 2 [Periplaneta americana]|uniref:queuine tRNA-ribosyltransferase accessory subunit 2 n=1 Tax=Periplaneta americana TaxID=6978 RepID=UPI0037E84CE7
MKYFINSVATCSSRLGCIRDIERLPGLVFETPLVLLYTKGGSVPHLSHEVLQMVTKDQQPLHIPISTVAHCHEAVAAYNRGIADFIGLKEHLTFCSLHDPAIATPQGFNDRETVSLWLRNGRRQIDPDKYMDMIEAFQPDMYQVLCDGDTNLTSSNKRVQKSMERSIAMFDKCIARHEKSEVLKGSAVLGVVEGGYSTLSREKSAKHLADGPVLGFVIDGLHNNGPEVEHIPIADVKPVLQETLKHLPSGKLRMVHGCWSPGAVLQLVELGIDAFDSSYPHIVTERGGALLFQNCLASADAADSSTLEQPLKKKQRTLVDGIAAANSSPEHGSDIKYEITLTDKKYAEDFSPLSDSCRCLACRQHTRAYIHHLLQTRELLGPVLLSIHNLHHYLEFFRSIREALKSNSLDTLQKCVNLGVQE